MLTSSDLTTLYLEDETLIALDGAETLRDLGVGRLHTARTLEKARDIARDVAPDLAILDVNIGKGRNSFDLARDLIARGARVIFVSGYNAEEFPKDLRDVPLVSKPFSAADLRAVLEGLGPIAARGPQVEAEAGAGSGPDRGAAD